MNRQIAVAFLGMATTAGAGLIAGWAIGDLTRRYRHGVEQLDQLRRQLERASSAAPTPERQIREMRSVLNDLHKMVHGVTKTLGKQPS